MSRRPPLPGTSRPSVWRSNAAGLAVLGLLLQLVLGQAAMLRMAFPATDAGTICASDHAAMAGRGARPQDAPQPVHQHHHEDCPLCAGFAPLLEPAASTPILGMIGRQIPPVLIAGRRAPERPAPAYNPRAPPEA